MAERKSSGGDAAAREITFVLPEPELNGGNKMTLLFAELLRRREHRVTVLAAGPCPSWSPFQGPFVSYREGLPELPPQDLVVATYWPTVELAELLEAGPVAHFCQGYEGDLPHLEPQRPEIEATYARRHPALVIAPHLADLLRERFGKEAMAVDPALDPWFTRRRPRWRPRRRPWIAVPGIFEAPVKGVPTALEALTLLERQGIAPRLLRISTLPQCLEEANLRPVDRFLFGEPPSTVARWLRRCDLLLFASRAEEGLGLPLLEAMACGVPAVASEIPSTRYFATAGVCRVPPEDPSAFAREALRLLRDPRLWRRARREALVASRRFAEASVAERLERALSWAVERARGSLPRPDAEAGLPGVSTGSSAPEGANPQ